MGTSTYTGGPRPEEDVASGAHAHAILSTATNAVEPELVPLQPSARGSSSDLARQPGGAPHGVIGLTALFMPVFAILAFVLLATSDGVVRVAGAIVLMIGLVVFVSSMTKKADVERDHDHPSR